MVVTRNTTHRQRRHARVLCIRCHPVWASEGTLVGPGRTPTVHQCPHSGKAVGGSARSQAPHIQHDTTHCWRPTHELAGDVLRTVTAETLVVCWTAPGVQVNESDDLWWLRPDGKTQVIYKADTEQDEARRRSQHRRFSSPHTHNAQKRFPVMTISDELLQMIEKMSGKPNKVRTITTARARST